MIPYNPSSFNSNKTILEQILELKNWLINHPQYEVYYCNDTALLSPVVNSFSLSDVPDNTNMDVGDLVVCNNAVYCTVMSVDRDNGVFTAGYGISFKGDTGATGNAGRSIRVSSENYVNDSTAYSRNNIQPTHTISQYDLVIFANDYLGYVSSVSGINFYVTATQNIKGDAGANGVSITGVTINASGHLIVTLSDGNTIDAGSVISGTGAYVIQLTSYTGTLSADDLAIVNDPSKTCIIDYYENSKHSFYFKDRQTTDGWRFSNLDYVEGSQITIMWYIEIDGTTGAYLQDYSEVFVRAENINSYGATSGQVLMADGLGGASWQNASGGSFTHYATISGNSGTLSQDDYDKLLYNDSVLVKGNYVYQKNLDDSSRMWFINCDENNFITIYAVTKATRYYVKDTHKLKSSGITSSGATSGQVLTADGSDGVSWSLVGASSISSGSISNQLCILHSDGTGGALFSRMDAGSLSCGTATNGQVLTARSGNAVWENPTGGTTLNKYTYSGSSTSDVYNIIANAKGRVTGYITLSINYTNISFNIANSYVDPYNYLRISSVSDDPVNASGLYSLYMTTTSTGTLNDKKAVCIASNGTITTYTTFTITDYQITYWNDTQLHT